MPAAPTDPPRIDAPWLATALDVDADAISGVAVEHHGETQGARYALLAVEHTLPDLPSRIFAKWTKPEAITDRLAGYNRRELLFYRDVATARPIPTPRFLAGNVDSRGALTLLLEDLSPTHRPWNTLAVAEQLGALPGAVRALADVHATWWGDPLPEGVRPAAPEPFPAWTQRVTERTARLSPSGIFPPSCFIFRTP